MKPRQARGPQRRPRVERPQLSEQRLRARHLPDLPRGARLDFRAAPAPARPTPSDLPHYGANAVLARECEAANAVPSQLAVYISSLICALPRLGNWPPRHARRAQQGHRLRPAVGGAQHTVTLFARAWRSSPQAPVATPPRSPLSSPTPPRLRGARPLSPRLPASSPPVVVIATGPRAGHGRSRAGGRRGGCGNARITAASSAGARHLSPAEARARRIGERPKPGATRRNNAAGSWRRRLDRGQIP